MNTKLLCNEVSLLAREVGAFLAAERKGLSGVVSSESKGIHDYVTRFDKESERRIVQRLKQLLPDSDFIAEEGPARARNLSLGLSILLTALPTLSTAWPQLVSPSVCRTTLNRSLSIALLWLSAWFTRFGPRSVSLPATPRTGLS